MRIDLFKATDGRLLPATRLDVEKLKRVRVGDMVMAHYSKERNGDHHRKLFAMLLFVAQNHRQFRTVEDVLVEVKLRVGHYTEHVRSTGEIVFVPKSIAYDEMDQAEFELFYKRAVEACADMVPGVAAGSMDRYIEQVLSFS